MNYRPDIVDNIINIIYFGFFSISNRYRFIETTFDGIDQFFMHSPYVYFPFSL